MVEKQKFRVVDLDSVPDFGTYEISVNGKRLPIAIGDKIQFPQDDPYLKTIVGIQVDENGIANYIIEWFEDSVFKQNTLSLTELKVLKDNVKQRNVIDMFAKQQQKDEKNVEKKLKKSNKLDTSDETNVKGK